MERLNKQKESIQIEAVKKWIESGKKGTCEIITGLGKTFIGLHCLLSMPKDDDKVHLFLAETTSREKDLKDDIKKFNKIYNVNILKDYNLQFYCYQSAYKWKDKKFGLVIADEIHDGLSPAYSKFFKNNAYDGIIGLTATVTRHTKYETSYGKEYTKGDLLDKIAPIIFKYDMNTGQEEGTSRKLDIYVISHSLDDKARTVKAGNKKKPFYQTEKAAYEYWDSQFKKALWIQDESVKEFRVRIASHKRSSVLYNMESKVPIIKKILSKLKDKTIVFGNSLDTLLKVTPNVVSSKNSEKENQKIREDFEKGKIKTIGSFKMLKQGANLTGLDNCIVMSYYSTEKDLIQRLGRLRKSGEKVGKVFILVTQGTKEEDWFNKMFENIDAFNIQYFMNVEQCLKKIEDELR